MVMKGIGQRDITKLRVGNKIEKRVGLDRRIYEKTFCYKYKHSF
jgi:hypothetical protein